MRYLSLQEVQKIHDDMLDEIGGLKGAKVKKQVTRPRDSLSI